jgi:hypothetical protein
VVVVSLIVVWVLWRFIARLLRRMRAGQITPALEP